MNETTEKSENSLTDVLLEMIGCDEDRPCTWYLAEAVDYADLERRLTQVGRRTRTGLFS